MVIGGGEGRNSLVQVSYVVPTTPGTVDVEISSGGRYGNGVSEALVSEVPIGDFCDCPGILS